jgi:hypothetical protein
VITNTHTNSKRKQAKSEDQLERQTGRRAYTKAGVVLSADEQIDHKKKIKDGGKSTKGNMRVRSATANMRDNGKAKT